MNTPVITSVPVTSMDIVSQLMNQIQGNQTVTQCEAVISLIENQQPPISIAPQEPTLFVQPSFQVCDVPPTLKYSTVSHENHIIPTENSVAESQVNYVTGVNAAPLVADVADGELVIFNEDTDDAIVYIELNVDEDRVESPEPSKKHGLEKPSTKYQCSQCGHVSGRRTDAVSHLRTHTGEKPWNCEICHKKFARRDNYREHLRTHTGEKPYSCPDCQRAFRSKVNLNRHLKTHSHERTYECNKCDMKFKRVDHLRSHRKSRHENGNADDVEELVTCPVCDTICNSKDALRQHIYLHKNFTQYKYCPNDECREMFKTKQDLEKHFALSPQCRQPDDLMRIRCEHCGCTFSKEDDFAKHIDDIVLETGVFKDSKKTESQRNSESTEAEEIEYPTNAEQNNGCDFSRPSNEDQQSNNTVVDHLENGFQITPDLLDKIAFTIQVEGPDGEMVSVPVEVFRNGSECDMTTPSEPELDESHFMTESEQNPNGTMVSNNFRKASFKCSFCDKSFNSVSSRVLHLRTHTGQKPYGCTVAGCDKRFSDRCNFRRHLLTHSKVKAHRCDICSKTFGRKHHLDNHLARHDDARAFQCSECGSDFKFKSALANHMKVHDGLKKELLFACEYEGCNGVAFRSKHALSRHQISKHGTDKPRVHVKKPESELLKNSPTFGETAGLDDILNEICNSDGPS